MNYFEFFIGSYEKKAAHLSMLKDGAYSRLMRLYYTAEGPLREIDGSPADVKRIQELARCASTADRNAVRDVLLEFFVKGPDGWRNERADEEIERFRAKIDAAQKAAAARWSKGSGGSGSGSSGNDAPPMRPHPPRKPDGDPPHTSHAIPHTSVPFGTDLTRSTVEGQPTPAGALCLAMRQKGVRAQPSDPRVIALVERGVSAEMVSQACDQAKETKKDAPIPAGYVLAIVNGWLNEPASAPARPAVDVASEAMKLAREGASGAAH